jgi:hypothetical protein
MFRLPLLVRLVSDGIGAMCRQLDALEQSITVVAQGFDPESLTSAEAQAMVRRCTRIDASITSIKALAAAKAAEQGGWKAGGYRSASDQLAHEAGMSPTKARRTLEMGRRLARQPEVAKAALAGELSPEQAALVAEGADANPARARDLIEQATQVSLSELSDAVARAKAEVIDLEDRRRRIHAKRSLRRWTDRDGAFHAHLYGQPEDGVGLWRALDPIRRRLIMLRRDLDERDTLDTLDYDALMTIAAIAAGHDDAEFRLADLLDLGLFPQFEPARHECQSSERSFDPSRTADQPGSFTDPVDPGPTPAPAPAPASGAGFPSNGGRRRRIKKLAGSPARVMIRVDLDTLLRGVPAEGELCEIAGHGPVPVSVIKDLAAQPNSFIVGVLTKHHQIQGIYHHRRRPNAHQNSALDFLYPTCAARGCNARAGLQSDHRVDWAKTKYTVYDLLDRLCPHHHRLKTQNNWALVPGTGKRDFVPPQHPQHPAQAKQFRPA